MLVFPFYNCQPLTSAVIPEFIKQCIACFMDKGFKPTFSPQVLKFVTTVDPPFRLPLSVMEAMRYYHGLPSQAILVARSSTDIWKPPSGPHAYLRRKELKTVGDHPLKSVWEDDLALQIHDILKSEGIQWTSTDVARIGFVGEPIAPVVIWIGVKPNTLSGKDGLVVVTKCKELLTARNILDVEVEIRESVVTRYVGPQLQKPALCFDPTAEVLEPLTPTLGLNICNANTPWTEGTGGFYVTGDDSKLFLVTARHVIFTDIEDNNKYEYQFTDQHRVDVVLLGTAAFASYVEWIKCAIGGKALKLDVYERRVKNAVEGGGMIPMTPDQAAMERADAERLVKEAKEAIVAFKKLHDDVEKGWAKIGDRVLGHVRFSPPLKTSAGPSKYTEDYALIEIDPSKIDASFTSNAIDLGTQFGVGEFTRLMSPNPQNCWFKYPNDRLFKVQGTIQDEEMKKPAILDRNGDPCLVVMKRGISTGLTVGHANNFLSYVQNYDDNGDTQTSKEWAIYPYDDKSHPFSEKGDSGSAIVDCFGRLGGLLTGGDGITVSSNITYATPISIILDSLKDNGYKVNVEVAQVHST